MWIYDTVDHWLGLCGRYRAGGVRGEDAPVLGMEGAQGSQVYLGSSLVH